MAVKRSIQTTIAVLLCGAGPALAQTASTTPPLHAPLQKAIGQDRPKIVPSLIVMNARGATLQGGQLTLAGVASNSIVFADRPVRAAGHSLTTDLLEEWSPTNESNESFTKDPPNATVSVFSKNGSTIRDAVVVLKTAKLEGDRLVFDVDVLEGDLSGGTGRLRSSSTASDSAVSAAFTVASGAFTAAFVTASAGRVGAVGVWHRPYVYRGAWYRGAGLGAAAVGGAALGAAAVGAAASAYPYGAYPYYGACGYYPNPPCY